MVLTRKLETILRRFVCCALLVAPIAHADALPAFKDFPASAPYSGPVAKPKLVTKEDRMYRTRLRESAKQTPNFAGHYVLTVFGCGASCVQAAALDAKTGKVTWLPFTVCCASTNAEPDAEPLDFRLNSRLLVVTGSRNEEGSGRYFYALEDGRFKLIRETAR